VSGQSRDSQVARGSPHWLLSLNHYNISSPIAFWLHHDALLTNDTVSLAGVGAVGRTGSGRVPRAAWCSIAPASRNRKPLLAHFRSVHCALYPLPRRSFIRPPV